MATKNKVPRDWPAAWFVRAVDGDTVELIVDTGFHGRFQDKFRLAGIDAPEHAATARQALEGLMAGISDTGRAPFRIQTHKPDKYGRWLVTIPLYEDGGPLATVNHRMIELGFAVPYAGGSR